MKMGYTILDITYDEKENRHNYKYSDRYSTYFKTFHASMSHQECIITIEKQLRSIAIKKFKEQELDRSKHVGTFHTIEYEV